MAALTRARNRPVQIGAGQVAAAQSERKTIKGIGDEAGKKVSALLKEAGVIDPLPEHLERIRELIGAEVGAYQRRAAQSEHLATLRDPAAAVQAIYDRITGLGPLQRLMDDPTVEAIICNGPARVYAYRSGRKDLEEDIVFDDDDELLETIRRVLNPLGGRIDQSSPMVDAQLKDGSRLNAITRPAAVKHTGLAIRLFRLKATTLEELVELGLMPQHAATFLDAAVKARINILISGGTNTGKTTLLNALGMAITDRAERMITIEDTAELQLADLLPDCEALQARSGNIEKRGGVKQRDLVKNALRMQPTRIILGEVRDEAALDMLRAMNTGHSGSMGTAHSNGARDALDQIALMAMYAREEMPLAAIKQMIARTIQLVLYLDFDRDQRRRLVHIYEVVDIDANGTILGQDLWQYNPETGRLEFTDLVPRCLETIRRKGIPYTLP